MAHEFKFGVWSATTIAAVIFLMSVHIVQAKESPEDCAKVRNNDLRLECYDLIFRHTRTVATDIGKWTLHSEQSKIDDTVNYSMVLKSDEPYFDRFGNKKYITFFIMCRENDTNISFHFGGAFMSDLQGKGRVVYRIDDKKAIHKNLKESNNHEHLGLWSGNFAIPFVKSLFKGKSLYIRAVLFSDSAVDGTFRIEGIKKVIEPLRKSCHW